jgi:hypothetical protein
MVRTALLAVLAASGIAAAQQPAPKAPPPGPPPKAPSTGEELAKPKVVIPEDAAAEMARKIIKKGDCTGAVATLSTAISVAQDKLTKDERISGSSILHKCATANKSWNSVIQAQVYLLDNAPDKANAEELIRAYLKLGQDKAALEMLKVVAKAVPSQKANLTLAVTLIDCYRNDFALCFKSSSKMLDVLAKNKVTSGRPLMENMLFHAMSAAALGNYEVYDKEIKILTEMVGKGAAAFDPLKTKVEEARAAKIFVDDDFAKELALGTYHLLTSTKIKNSLDNADALVTLRFVNQDAAQKSIKVSIEIPGVTDRIVETVALPPGKQVTKLFSPPLKMDFDVAKLRAARTSQIAVRIQDQGTKTSIVDKSVPIQILPRDSLPTRRYVGNDDMRTTFNYSAAWVTPNAPEVDVFLKRAKARLDAAKDSFSGMQQPTLPQVKAIFDELKAMGVSYVMDPNVFDERGSVQRTRLPAEVLSSTNAQCLEGAILYATLFEAIGLHPVMVFKKGHAFIAWKPSKFDKTKAPLFFLETTLTGGPATFEQAMASAERTFMKARAERQFELGIGALLDIHKLRAQGYSPQPF